MKLFTIMNGFEVMGLQNAAFCRTALKKMLLACMMVLSLSAGAVYAQSPTATATITPNYTAETLTLGCTGTNATAYDTYYWTTDETITNPQDLYDADEEGSQSTVLSVLGMADGSVVTVWAMYMNGDTPVWSASASLTIRRYDAPAVTANYTSISSHFFSVTNDNTGTTEVRYAVHVEPTASSDVVTAACTVAVAEYYTTYNFRVFGDAKFPSESVSKSTDRYDTPVIVDYVPYSAATGDMPETPTSGTIYAEAGAYVYINATHGTGGDPDTLMFPDPSNSNTYDMVVTGGSSVPSTLTGDVFKMVAGPNPNTHPDDADHFPSPMVRVDRNYSGYYVIQHSETTEGVTTNYYLALDNGQLQYTSTFNYGCLWTLDGGNRLYQQNGDTYYYLSSAGGVLAVNTSSVGDEQWRIHPVSHLLQDYEGKHLVHSSQGWRLVDPGSSTNAGDYFGAYMVSKRHATGGQFKDITRFELDAITYDGKHPQWIALADGDAACSLSVTPQVTVTTYALPEHVHYFYTDNNNVENDFTYYARNGHSYAVHEDLPYQREVGNNNNANRNNISYIWHLEFDEAAGEGLACGEASVDANANATTVLSRTGTINAPHRARMWVEATYTITNTSSDGDVTTVSRTATSDTLVVYAEQNAATLMALNSGANTATTFADGHYYLLANYSEKANGYNQRHMLTGTAGNATPYLSTAATPERLFRLDYNSSLHAYTLHNMTLDEKLQSTLASSNYVSDPVNPTVFYGNTASNTSDLEFHITPYQDGDNTYFTICPSSVTDAFASLVPQSGDMAEGVTLRMANSKSSEHLQGVGTNASYNTFDEDYYRSCRWQLVVPTLLPPEIHMDVNGTVTLTDVRPYISGTLKYQTKNSSTDEWGVESTYVENTTVITLTEGQMLRAWKEGAGNHAYLPSSNMVEFTAYKVATPTYTPGSDNMVTLSCETPGATIYYSINNSDNTEFVAYDAPFAMDYAGTLQFYAEAPDMLRSETVTQSHTAVLPLQIEVADNFATLSMRGGNVPGNAYIIYYTTDGTNPTNASSQYTDPIALDGVFLLKAQAVPSSEGQGYTESPVEHYYHNSQILAFTYLDRDREENHTPSDADTNMMLLGDGNIVRNHHNIDNTFLWRCSNAISTTTASTLFNEATMSYLTVRDNNGEMQVYGTTTPSEAKSWYWSGEPTDAASNDGSKYRMYTIVGSTTYYLAFDKANRRWLVTSSTAVEGQELSVAYRTDLVDYVPNEPEFAAKGINLFLAQGDDWVELDSTTAWLALSQTQSATLRASMKGAQTAYVANTDINIHKWGYDVGVETDPDSHVPWQQWHRKDGQYYHYYYDVPGCVVDVVSDALGSNTAVNWQYGNTLLSGSGSLDGNYFTYQIDADHPDIIVLTRIGTINAPVLNLSPLTAIYHQDAAYANNGMVFDKTVPLALYAENEVVLNDSELGQYRHKRLVNLQTEEFLSTKPDQLVTGISEYPYLAGVPVVGTSEQYTKYGVWRVLHIGIGNCYRLRNMVFQDDVVYRRPDNVGGLYLCDSNGNAMFDYLHRNDHPANPIVGNNAQYLYYQIKKYANGEDEYYVTISPYGNGQLGLSADNSWQTVSYGHGGVDTYKACRWGWEFGSLTPPDISMNPSGEVTLTHRLQTDVNLMSQVNNNILKFYYTTDGSEPQLDNNNEPVSGTHEWVWDGTNPTTLTLVEGQTIKAIAQLTNDLIVDGETAYEAHTSLNHTSFTAVRTVTPSMVDGTLTATEGDSLVMGVNQALESVHWNTEGAEGIVRYDQSTVRRSEYADYFDDGDVMEVVAYRHNQLESEHYYYTQQQQLHLAVASVTVGEVGTDNTYSATITFNVTGSAHNGREPLPQYYQIRYSYGAVGGSQSTPTTFDGLTLTLNGLSGAQVLTALVEPRADFENFYTQSDQLSQYIVPAGYTGSLAQDANNIYLINNALDLVTVANMCNGTSGSTYLSASYKVTADIDLTGINLPSIGSLTNSNLQNEQPDAFQGKWDGGYKVISHAAKPLFTACSNAHVYNVVIANSSIITTENGAWGAICATACGSTHIYNSGVRATTTVSGKGQTGGIAGRIHGMSRVVNCYNFASVFSENSDVGGIVGNQQSASSRTDINCLIFNCVNYGDISTAGTQKVGPVAKGNTTKSSSTGFNTYNYFLLNIDNIKANKIDYNGAMAVEKDYLTRFEFYRLILNSNRKKCGRWVNADAYTEGSFTDVVAADGGTIGTWVLDTNIAEFPIVLPKYEGVGASRTVKRYPSIINPDYDNTARRDTLQPYEGKRLGTLNVTVNGGTYASSSSSSWSLNITDMDTNAYDYSYQKVQLPYFQDVFGVGSNVVTSGSNDYIVTGWKITSVQGGSQGTYTAGVYDFASRDTTQKDLYAVSGRVFAQGGYYMVPNGVTDIVIEAYWGKAIYLSEVGNESAYNDNNGVDNLSSLYGTCAKTLYGTTKTTQTTISGAMSQLSDVLTVYDQAIVLLSDFHANDGSAFFNSSHKQYPLTIMSVDEDNDHEPDHCLFQSYMGRIAINPVRFDMVVHAGFNMAGLPSGKKPRELTICLMRGHFEITETALAHYSQFEYDLRGDNNGLKELAPLILNGGVFDQIVSGENKPQNHCDRTEYIQLGGHVWFKMFSPGAHGNTNTQGKKTKHCPVTVTGGEYKSFYLSGMFRPDVQPFDNDNPCLYASGGKFGHYASGGHDKIGGNVTVKADHIIVDEFYGGGINPTNFGTNSNPSYSIGGNISITLNNSIVGQYAAGPKFGGMNPGKTVETYAEGTTFGTYYGAGYGGTGLKFYFAEEMNEALTYSDNFINNNYNNQRGKYQTGNSAEGITIDYEFDFMQRSASNANHTVRRIYNYRAELSNAPTNAVTSTLKNCHVKGNYYGAGYVGRVNGKAMSTLENCIIDSNVFAGGNSSTAPKAKVYPSIDLTKKPELITTTYYIPTKPAPTEYTWTTDANRTYRAGNVEIEETADGRFLIYTSKNLNAMGMGQADETELTIKGNTLVKGSVFGGGNLAEVAGNTTLTIGEETIAEGEELADHRPYIYRNVYGGGNVADVGTNTGLSTTTVNVYQGYMRSVYGGGNQGSIGGNTVVNLKGGFVGYRPVEQTTQVEPEPTTEPDPATGTDPATETELATVTLTVPEAIRPTIGRDKMFFGVYGGGFGIGTTVAGTATVNVGDATMTDDIKVFGSVYGGGEAGQVGGGYRKVTLKDNEALTTNHYWFDMANTQYVRCNASEARVEGRDYYTFVQPTFAALQENVNSGTSVRIVSDGTKTTEIGGAVYGGGRGYYLALENDTVVQGSEVVFRRPTAGAVYGNTNVEIGAAGQDTTKLKIGSLRFFTDFEKAAGYGLIDRNEITSSPMGYWRQNLFVYDVDVLRYVPLTTGENMAVNCNALTKAGTSKTINTSAESLDDQVQYFMATGRVSVAGGGENGRVFGSTVFDNTDHILFGNAARYGATGGCTQVTIHSGTMGDIDDIDHVVSGDVYGAGLKADIDGTSSVTIDGTSATAWIRGDVYAGGCMGTNHAYNRASENDDIYVTTATVTGGWLRNLHAASNLVELPTNGNSLMMFGSEESNAIDDDLLVSESIYGGSGLSYMLGTTDVTMNSGRVGFVRAGYYINAEDEDITLPDGVTKGNIIPNVDNVLSYEGNVYGGGYGPNAYVKKTKVTVNGGVVRNGVFGGGELAPVGEIVAEVGDGVATYRYYTYENGSGKTVPTYYIAPTAAAGSGATMGFATDVVINGGRMSGVYGGGRGYSNFLNVESTMPGTIMGSASVYVGGGTIDAELYSAELGGGNVYGGGLEGEVTGDTRVTIAGGTVDGHVFAGGRGYCNSMFNIDNYSDIFARASRRAGWVLGNTSLTVKDSTNSISPTITYGVYGGGEGLIYKTRMSVGSTQTDVVAVVDGNATVNITGGTIGGGHQKGNDPYRGSYAGGRVASVNGYADMLVSGNADISSVYGGNDISGLVIGQNAIRSAVRPDAVDNTCTYVHITGTPQVGHVFGGGNGQYPYYNDVAYDYLHLEKPVQTQTYVDIETSGGSVGQAFGGGNSASVGTAEVLYHGNGRVDTVFAGGNSATVTDAATVTVDANEQSVTTSTPEHIGYLFGGNNMAAMSILPTLNLTKGVMGYVYGGGNAGAMTGHGERADVFAVPVTMLSTYVLVNSSDVTIRGALFGGCNNAVVRYGTYVDVRHTSAEGIKMMFGGNDISEHVSNARVDISGGLVSKMFGGGNGYYDYMRNGNNWDVYAKQASQTGGNEPSPAPSSPESSRHNGPQYEGESSTDPGPVAINTVGRPTVGETQVNIWGGTVDNSIYGGGYAGDCGTTHVVVNDTVNWDEANASNDPLGRTTGGNATINGKIFGGGYGDIDLLGTASQHVGNVTDMATTDLYHVNNLHDAYAYGGGEAGDVHDAVINVHKDWNQPLTALYGGCYGSDVTGTATVNMYCEAPASGYNVTTLYGGNDYTGMVNRSVLNVYDGKYGRVFGAGNGKYTYSGGITPPNSQYPTVNFYDGIVTGNLYGGGDQGMCFVGTTPSVASSNLEDYAHVVVNIHGGNFNKDIFAGAAGDETLSMPLVYGLKQLNMDGGEVHNSVYGGSESVKDGYPAECIDKNSTTQRPSSILNITGGTIHNNVYGGGYLGVVHGSIYVNVGEDAVNKSPVWTNSYNGTSYLEYKPTFVSNEDDDIESNLKKRSIELGASIYNGANWGEAGTNVFFITQGFFGGESRIYVDGNGYNTSGSDEGSSMPEMDIYYSLIGAGTSCEGGDVERHILVRNYGERNGCETSKTFFSIQRADTVRLQNTAIKLIGDQDALSAYPSSRYSVNRVKCLRLHDYNVLEIDEPIARTGRLQFITSAGATDTALVLRSNNTEALSVMRSGVANVNCSTATVCERLNAAVDPAARLYSTILANNGVSVDIVNEEGTLGAVEGYGFLLSQDGYRTIVTARSKTETKNQNDGGFFSCCNENTYTQNGAYHDGNAGEFSFVNNIEGNNSTYRTWKSDDEITSHTTRKVTIVAHSNVNKLDNNRAFASDLTDDNGTVMFGLAKGTIDLPSTSSGHYYTIEDGVQNVGNSDLILLTGAFKPNDFSAETVSGTWQTMSETTAASVQNDINGDPSHKFGLLMTSGGNFAPDAENMSTTAVIATNTVYSSTTNAYRTASVTASTDENEVIPKLDFYLTYSTEFATTTFGEVAFVLTERDATGQVVGKVDVSVSLTTIIEEFRNQSYDLVAMHNNLGNNEYSRKMVLPASMQRRNLYLTSVQWAPCTDRVTIDGRPREGTGIGHPATETESDTTKFYLTDAAHTTLMSDGFTFALKMTPTEYLSQSMSTTLGWYSIEDHELDIYGDAGLSGDSAAYSSTNATDRRIAMAGADLSVLDALRNLNGNDPPDPTAYTGSRGQFVGVLDGRSAAAIDISLLFDGTTDSIYLPQDGCRGITVLGFDYWNGDTWQGHFDVTVYIRTRSQGDTIYLASANHITRNEITIGACNDNSEEFIGLKPSLYVQTLEYALYNIYQAGDVLCIIDELDITGNQSLHGLDYSYIPVIRYEGHHIDFPGRECAYQGTMIKVKQGANLTTDNIVFDGSMVSRYLTSGADNDYSTRADNKWPTGTLTATGPIFEVENGGTLNLGNNTVLQNNFNTYDPDENQTYTYNAYEGYIGQTTPQRGGAVHVSTGGLLKMENSVTIKNNLEAVGVSSGAVHVDGGTVLLGIAKDGTAIHIEENYLIPASTNIVDATTRKLSLPDNLALANVYLTRTGVGNSEIADAQSDMILFESQLAADTRIGISKDFPGIGTRDTIRIAQVSGSHPQYAQRAYSNQNFFNDGTDGKVFFNSTISTKTIYFQRCATFQKQLYDNGQNPLNYIVLQNGVPTEVQNGYQQPVLTYKWNQYAACPDETDSLIYQVHGGFYPYTYKWEWGNSANSLSSYREYTTPYTNDAINADLANNDFAKATGSNLDAGELHGMLLNGGSGGTFFYRVTASDLAGCELTKNVKVVMSHQDSPAGITLDGHLSDNDYAWGDTANVITNGETSVTNIHVASRNFRGIHLVKHVVPDPSWGDVYGYMGQTEVTLTDGNDGTLLCPGDAIQLTASASDNSHSFIQWDFDPYDESNTVFVMPHSITDVTIKAYFGPNDYWKNVVDSKPEDASITYDYNGDVHIYDADGLAWLISLTNGLNGQQIREFYFNTVYIHNPNAVTGGDEDSKEGESTATAFDYDMSEHLWTPMGGAQHRFMGKLMVDEGVTISGIIVNEPRMGHVGFFAYLDSANIDGLHLQKSLFHGSQYVGGIAAEAVNSTIDHSSVADTGVVEGSPDITTIITANYASGGLVGTATNSTFDDCHAAAKYMGATIYNGGILGVGQDVDVENSWVQSLPRMSSLYSAGIVGSVSGPEEGTKEQTGSRIANNYVHFVSPYNSLNRVGGLVGYARNTTMENNYVYGSTNGGTLTGAIGAMLDRGVTVRNCYYEQGSNDAAFGYSGTDNHTAGITTFNGNGNQVMMADRVDGSGNLTLALNRWVRDYGGEGFATWRSDLEGINHGYPRFGEPDIVPVYENISYETCDSLIMAGETLTESGMYEFHMVDSADFVDSTIVLTLTLNYSSLTQFEDTVLMGEDYEAYGFHLTATEIDLLREAAQEDEVVTVVVSDTLQSIHGCDSIVTLYLTVNKRGGDQPLTVLDVKVYPNPTVAWIIVEADEMQLIELYDGVSRCIDRRTVEGGSSKLDLSNLPTGMYYLRVKTVNGIVIKKIIKQ